ncbi:MAG: (2Fe-2S)-binding protein [Bacteroidetes bacterium]|nr:(2Fe-2S)-binding protein [Bacteroidota bacterium]
MAAITLTVNGKKRKLDVDPDMPLLWALRDSIGLTGTKYGCGIGQCGACTVLIEGEPMRSCSLPVAVFEGKKITTIEGLSESGNHPVQQAWEEVDVPQCGYCQAGQIMTTVALLEKNPSPTDADIDIALAGNICRCGTYNRIRKAVHIAAQKAR